MTIAPKPSPALPIQGDFPPATIPTVYADGVTSLAPSPYVIKFYLARLEPHLRAEDKTLTQPFVQVVMSTIGFLQTAIFFENAIKNMQAQGLISAQQLEEARTTAGGKSQ